MWLDNVTVKQLNWSRGCDSMETRLELKQPLIARSQYKKKQQQTPIEAPFRLCSTGQAITESWKRSCVIKIPLSFFKDTFQ